MYNTPYGYPQQNPYGFGAGQGLGQQGSLFGGAQANNNNIDTGSPLGNALMALCNIFGQVGDVAIRAAYAKNMGAGAFGGGLGYPGFNPYSSPYGGFNGLGATSLGFGGLGPSGYAGAYSPNFGQYSYGLNSFRPVS